MVVVVATPLSADQMLSALKAEGLRPVEYKAWDTHNRNHVGSWGGVNGVVIHHTAGRDSRELCYNGRSDLPGPLCHAHLAKDGTLSLIGNGRTNHGGLFTQNAHTAVLNESSTHPRPSGSEVVDANQHYYGIEIENLGNGSDPYPAAQYEAAVRWATAICRAHGWSADSVIGHKEGTTRKIDPSFNMDTFRAAVRARLKGATAPEPEKPTEPTPPKEEAVTDADIKKIADLVVATLRKGNVTVDEGKVTVDDAWRRTLQNTIDLKNQTGLRAAIRAELNAALKGAVIELHISE